MLTTLLDSFSKHGIEVNKITLNDFAEPCDHEEFNEIAKQIKEVTGNYTNVTNKNFTRAPLPFQGQKMYFWKPLIEELDKHQIGNGAGYIFIDMFGGSGLLSHHLKKAFPEATVIWNDFDDYQARLKHIPQTNQFFLRLYKYMLEQNAFAVSGRIAEHHKTKIIQMVHDHLEEFKFFDCYTVTDALLFSTHATNNLHVLEKETFYNRLRLNPLRNAYGYLDGVIRIATDFQKIILSLTACSCTNKIILVMDPPYIGTFLRGYNNGWKMEEQIALLKGIAELGLPFALFGSTKAQLPHFLEQASYATSPIKERLKRYGYVLDKDAENLLNPFANLQVTKLAGSGVNGKLERGEFMVSNFKRLKKS